MISQDPRCIYQNNPLAEVICQLRFPEILTIQANIPIDFQESIRQMFPGYSVRKEPIFNQTTATNNYQFVTADGIWRINLTSSFISLACSRYTCWEDFARMLDSPLAAFIQIYKPAYFERIGLRYINFISRKQLKLDAVPFKELYWQKKMWRKLVRGDALLMQRPVFATAVGLRSMRALEKSIEETSMILKLNLSLIMICI